MKKKNNNFYKTFKTISSNFLNPINNSKLLAGLGLIILNYFSKYAVLNFSKSQEAFIKNTITREIIIFLTVFTGTRDLLLSLFLTATFIVLSGTIFNENSQYCVIPEKYKYLYNEVDTNKDGKISDEEIRKAQDILFKAQNQINNPINNSINNPKNIK
jgi:hypothetical protein